MWIYKIPGKTIAEAVVRQLDALPDNVLVGLAVFATGLPGAVSWFVMANTKVPTSEQINLVEKTLAAGQATTHTVQSLHRLRPHFIASGSGEAILLRLRSVDFEGYEAPARVPVRPHEDESRAQIVGDRGLCDFSIDRHVVERDEESTISAREVARFSKAYAHMVFDQLPENERRKIRESGEEAFELAKYEAVAKGLRVYSLDQNDRSGFQSVDDWSACRLHCSQWETYKLRYPPEDLT